jgi:hypothetical protein
MKTYSEMDDEKMAADGSRYQVVNGSAMLEAIYSDGSNLPEDICEELGIPFVKTKDADEDSGPVFDPVIRESDSYVVKWAPGIVCRRLHVDSSVMGPFTLQRAREIVENRTK